MNLKVIWTSRFKKDYKLAIKRNLNIELLDDVIRMLAAGQTLPEEYNDHQLTGNLKDYRECHIQPDWLLMYRIEKKHSCSYTAKNRNTQRFVRQINIGTISVTVCRFTVKPSRFFIMTALTKALPVAFIPKQFIITSVRFDMVNHRSLNVFPVPLTNLAQRMFSKICLT